MSELEGSTALHVQTFNAWAQSNGSALDIGGLTQPSAAANPALADLANGRFAIAWTDLSGGSPDVALRAVSPGVQPSSAPAFAHAERGGPQGNPALLWTGAELIVAWEDGFDLERRRFDAELRPLEPEQSLSATSSFESHVALASFAGSWAAAWRASADGRERIVAKAGALEWQVGPFAPGGSHDRPALLELDPTHLLLLFTEGTDPAGAGQLNVGRLRAAILDWALPGAVVSIALPPLATAAQDARLAQRRPTAVRVGNRMYIGWELGAALGDPMGSDLYLARVHWEAARKTLTRDTEIPLAPGGANRNGDQHVPLLASAPLYPLGALLVAWEDWSGLGVNRPRYDVAMALWPEPERAPLVSAGR